MARAITIDDLRATHDLPQDAIEQAIRENIEYAADLYAAFGLAKLRGLASATLSVARTPTPGSDDEVIDISIRGMAKAADFNEAVKGILRAGPDDTTHVWEVDNGQHSGTDELPNQHSS